MNTQPFVKRARKALVAGAGAGLAAALATWFEGGHGLTSQELAQMCGAFVVAAIPVAVATYQIRNAGTINGSDPIQPAGAHGIPQAPPPVPPGPSGGDDRPDTLRRFRI